MVVVNITKVIADYGYYSESSFNPCPRFLNFIPNCDTNKG